MNQHLAYFNTGERGNAIEGWGYIDERISTLLGPQAFGSRRRNPYGLHKDLDIFDKELNQMTTKYCPHSLENFCEKIFKGMRANTDLLSLHT